MTQPDTPYDVLVIGAGPSGLATAIAPARSGARVLLVEKHPEVSIFPKATGIRGRSMEIIRSWGLEDKVRAVARIRAGRACGRRAGARGSPT